MLEDRLTPASLTFYWKGTDNMFAKATNWFGSAFEAEDITFS